MSNSLYTIGHSNHSWIDFMRLLKTHSIHVIADVRSSPYSRRFPQFNREPLSVALKEAGIQYVFMGDSLGGRPADPGCYESGQVQYDRVAIRPAFQEGVNRICRGAEEYRIVLMCAEKDPITCHRFLLDSRHLSECGMDIQHILADGSLESQEAAENRMMDVTKLPHADLFESRETLLAKAYTVQARTFAYRKQNEP
jgi:uncharacterized protein (DUF488 family)